ncbi:MAG: VWA domain-containing protein [Rhodospirillaceae bacterium]|nr:VWA domain-containing protein [Rhodospirillaceae bacterium]
MAEDLKSYFCGSCGYSDTVPVAPELCPNCGQSIDGNAANTQQQPEAQAGQITVPVSRDAGRQQDNAIRRTAKADVNPTRTGADPNPASTRRKREVHAAPVEAGPRPNSGAELPFQANRTLTAGCGRVGLRFGSGLLVTLVLCLISSPLGLEDAVPTATSFSRNGTLEKTTHDYRVNGNSVGHPLPEVADDDPTKNQGTQTGSRPEPGPAIVRTVPLGPLSGTAGLMIPGEQSAGATGGASSAGSAGSTGSSRTGGTAQNEDDGTDGSAGGGVQTRKQALATAPPPRCQAGGFDLPVIFIVDGSVSMGLHASIPLGLEAALDARIDAGDDNARQEYRAWMAKPGPKRLDVAKMAFMATVPMIEESTKVGAVTFRDCDEVRAVGPVPADERSTLVGAITGLTVRRGGDTAIARALLATTSMLSPAGGHVILITDGGETCGGSPCEIAAGMKIRFPSLVIDVIDLSGKSNTACVADLTGGRVLVPDALDHLSSLDPVLGDVVGRCEPVSGSN